MLTSFKSFSRRSVKFLVAVCVCTLLFVAHAFPAVALDSYQSNPKEGEAQLNETIRKSEELTRKNPRSAEEMQQDQEGKGGLNAVQGKADVEKMSRPQNTPESSSVEKEVREGLQKRLQD